MTNATNTLTPFFAVTCDRFGGGYLTLLIESEGPAAARDRARSLGASPTLGLKAHRVSVYEMRFHGGNKVHPLTGEAFRLAFWSCDQDNWPHKG